MRKVSFVIILFMVGAWCAVHRSAADTVFTVDESGIRIRSVGTASTIELPILNPTDRPVEATVRLEVLDPLDVVSDPVEVRTTLPPGRHIISVPWQVTVPEDGATQMDAFQRSRLRYAVTPGAESRPVVGLVSLFRIMPDFFRLTVMMPVGVAPGRRFDVRVRARHPLTGAPVPGVTVATGAGSDSDSNRKLPARAVMTDAAGDAVLSFLMPSDLATGKAAIEVNARLGPIRQTWQETVSAARPTPRLLQTDRPFYQPGQTMRVRLLAFTPERRALVSRRFSISVVDEQGEKFFETEVETSRFGVAHCEWGIPESARLGTYRVVAVPVGKAPEDDQVGVEVGIRRYELPNFTVAATSDKTFYLPGENASVVVQGDYLFGRPVKGGRVRIARMLEPRWNEEAGQMEGNETVMAGGEADETGAFTAKLDLSALHAGLDGNERFLDGHFSASVTDPTTGRTESQWFDLRVSREAIHVYIEENPTVYRGLPPLLKIRTARADGTPVACDIRLFEAPIFDGKLSAGVRGEAEPAVLLGQAQTSRYGLGKIGELIVPKLVEQGIFGLSLVARSADGATGKFGTTVMVSDEPAIRVMTDGLLYRGGQPLTVEVLAGDSVASNETVIVQLVDDEGVVGALDLRLEGRRGRVTFTETGALQGPVTIVAVCPFTGSGSTLSAAPRTVLFPEKRNLLTVTATPDKSVYRPGDPAALAFVVRDGEGHPVESALGVAVIDRSLSERFRRESPRPLPGFVNRNELAECAGVKLKDLQALDPAQPLPPDLAAVAENILTQVERLSDSQVGETGDGPGRLDEWAFFTLFEKALNPVGQVLDVEYEKADRKSYPREDAAVRAILARNGIVFDDLRDPWGQPFRLAFGYAGPDEVLSAVSAGPDEQFDTDDDLPRVLVKRRYFLPVIEVLDRTAAEYRARTGNFIGDADTLVAELKRNGLDFNALRDPWGHPYRITVEPNFKDLVVSVVSIGPNGFLDPRFGDDFTLWELRAPFFLREIVRVQQELRKNDEARAAFPTTAEELRAVLKADQVDFDTLTDAWKRPVWPRFTNQSRKAERRRIESVAGPNGVWQTRILVQPLEQQVVKLELVSPGEDGKPDTDDDFPLATIWRIVSERPTGTSFVQPPSGRVIQPPAEPGKGNVTGLVRDQSGAVIGGATVNATDTKTGREYKTTTSDGPFLLAGLPVGKYDIAFSANGFETNLQREVEIFDLTTFSLDMYLKAAGSVDIVEVSAGGAVQLNVTRSALSSSRMIRELPVNGRSWSQFVRLQPGSVGTTPRVREYFPETLLWQPEVITDSRGRARIPFKLADTLTTWRMSVIASTADGRIATAEQEMTTFQPFFAELDPPRVLTEGDEIALPVVVRNYLKTDRDVTVDLAPAKWFAAANGGSRRVVVKAGDSATVSIPFRATQSVRDGRQRVTARSGSDGDAVEKPVTVHPDGIERTATAGGVFGETATFETTIPADALPNSGRMELKVYPNFAAHAFEGITGILQRPHGCGEQTISSTYPNVLVLQYLKRSDAPDSTARAEALRNAREGYERLLGYQDADGGFTYWGSGSPDPALTAYALRFLRDVAEFVPTDETVASRARLWLIGKQLPDGSWADGLRWTTPEHRPAILMNTAYLAWTLAGASDAPSVAATEKALAFLDAHRADINEPYTLAVFALAARAAGQPALADAVVTRLRGMAKTSGESVYWSQSVPTPFHGWGAAGDIETTALALSALTPDPGATDETAARATAFLLSKKDRYGVWHSTQATINTEQALIALVAPTQNAADRTIRLTVDGKPVRTIALSKNPGRNGPVIVDASVFASPGPHRIAFTASGSGGGLMSAQVVTGWYAPWSTVPPPAPETAPNLSVAFDRTTASVGETVSCSVEILRAGSLGRGMLVAEIGLPPGADVDQGALEQAVRDGRIQRYDIQPDRVVLYAWPQGGLTQCRFGFRPRYGMKAKTAASTLYDYYNPDAATTLAPVPFIVK